MRKIYYVTTNINKFNRAAVNLSTSKVELTHQPLELQEVQSSDGEIIVRNKVEQAYEYFNQPVLANDDTWSIPALRGFPSTGMKLCNDFLCAKDWLRLMEGIEDRRIFLQSHFAYHDGVGVHHLMSSETFYLLLSASGVHKKSPCLEVIGRQLGGSSIAEEITAGMSTDQENADFWRQLSELLAGE